VRVEGIRGTLISLLIAPHTDVGLDFEQGDVVASSDTLRQGVTDGEQQVGMSVLLQREGSVDGAADEVDAALTVSVDGGWCAGVGRGGRGWAVSIQEQFHKGRR
jgi:hypothetical protein